MGIGFGVSTPEDVKNFSKSNADGIVIESAIVEKIHSITPALNSFLPDNSSSIPISASPTEFELDLVEPVPNTLKIDWVLNGVTIHKNVNSLVINASDLQGGATL